MIRKITLSLFFISTLTFSQEILESKLIETNTSGSTDPKGMVNFNDKILYSSSYIESSYDGRNLYEYNPSENNIKLIKKVNTSYSYPGITSKIYKLSNNSAMFLSKTGVYDNAQLWETDGTEEGTAKIYTFSNYFDDFTISKVVNKRLIFSRDYYNDQNTYAIGEGETAPVKLASGNVIGNIVKDQNYCYFFVKNGLDIKLVKTDGTLNGTEILSTNNYIYYSYYYNLDLTLYNNKLYYSISDSDYKYKLFAFDLLSKNSSVIFNSDTSTNAINSICAKLGSDLVYIFNKKIYRISGNSLEFVKDFPQGYNGNISSTSYALNNKLFFNTTDNKVLSVDADFNLSIIDFENSNSIITNVLDSSDFLVVGIPNATTSTNMWLYDGADKKFKILVSSDKSNFASIGDNVYFAGQKSTNDRELYKISKTTGDISLTKDANLTGSGDPRLFISDASNNFVFFAKDDNQRYQFFVKKRNQNTVTKLSSFETTPTGQYNSYPIYNTIFSLGDYFYLASGNSFYRTTINEGSSLLLAGPVNDLIISYKIIKNQLVYMTYNSSQYETKIWSINNDRQSPVLLKTYYSTSNNNISNYGNLDTSIVDENWAYFMITNYDGSTNFLRTDGSSTNTKIITTTTKGQGRYLFLGISDNKIFYYYNLQTGDFMNRFSYIDLSNNVNSDLNIGNYYPNRSVLYKNKIYFASNGDLFTIDKTGVSMVKDFTANDDIYFSDCGGRLFLGKTGLGIFTYDGISDPTEVKYNSTSINNIYGLYMRGQVCLKDTFFLNGNPDLYRIEKNSNTAKKYSLYYNNSKASYISEIGTDGEKLYFNYNTEANGYELFEVTSELNLATSEVVKTNEKSKIYLYPNPASDFIKIRNESANKINSFLIYDFSGKIISEGKYTGENQNINISNMIKGTYIIEVKTNSGKSYSHKFIKN